MEKYTGQHFWKYDHKEWNFPCYGKTIDGVVVYFDSEFNGVVVVESKDDPQYTIGYSSNSWGMTCFTPCILEIKEQNESNQNH